MTTVFSGKKKSFCTIVPIRLESRIKTEKLKKQICRHTWILYSQEEKENQTRVDDSLFAMFDSPLNLAKTTWTAREELLPPFRLLPAGLVEDLYIIRVFFQICKEPFPLGYLLSNAGQSRWVFWSPFRHLFAGCSWVWQRPYWQCRMALVRVILCHHSRWCLSVVDHGEAVFWATRLLHPFLYPGGSSDAIRPTWSALLGVHNRFRPLSLTECSVLSAFSPFSSSCATFARPLLSLVYGRLEELWNHYRTARFHEILSLLMLFQLSEHLMKSKAIYKDWD